MNTPNHSRAFFPILLALAAMGGGIGLQAQTVLLGTYDNVVISGDVSIATNTSATFVNGSSFTGANANFGSNAYLYWNQNGTLSGKAITLGSGSSFGIIDVGSGNSLTFDSATSLTGDLYVYGNSGSTIINQGAISQTAGTGYLYAPTFSNQGSITAGANATLYVGYNNGETLTNTAAGTITADGANAAVIFHAGQNLGTITAQNGGAVYFSGSSTTADLGNVQIGTGGGHAYLYGVLDNTSATLTAPGGGTYELYSGTINNGTIAAGALTFTTSNGTLSNVVYTGNLNLAANFSVTFTNGTSFTGSGASLGNNAYLYWNQNGTLAGKAITLGSGGSFGIIDVGSGNSLTFDSASSVTGNLYVYGNSGSTIINQGAISQTSGTGYLYAPTFSNQGSITANANASLYVGYNNGESTTNAAAGTMTADGTNSNLYLHGLANLGTVTAQNGGAVYFTGSSTTADLGNVQIGTGGGHAYLDGILDNTSATLNAPGGGTYELYSGTVSNGTIAAGALNFTNGNGTLSNVVYTGNLNLPANTSVTFTNGTSFTGSAAALGDNAYLYWNQNATLAGKAITLGSGSSFGIVDVGSGNSLTFDSASSLTGNNYVYGNSGSTIINQGSISQTSGTGYLYAPTFSNQGSIATGANASLYVGYNNGESSTNAAAGTMTANGTNSNLYLHGLANLGTVTAQNGGALYFTGNATTADLGNVQIGTGGGHAYLEDVLDNTSATLTAPGGGTYELYSGTINNGTIAAGALTFTSSNGTLSNVTYTGNLTMPGSTYVTFTNGTSFTGSAATLGDNAYIYWNQNGTLAGKAISLGAGGGYGVIDVAAGDSLTLDGASSATGDIYIYGNAGSTLVNQGAVTHTYGTGYFYGPSVTNQGAIAVDTNSSLYFGYNNGEAITNAANGTITATGTTANLYLHGVVNLGTVTAQNGGAVFFIGNNVTSDLGNVQIGTGGGHAYLEDILDNTAATLTAPTGGTYELYSGTISNGTIAAGALTFTSAGGTLSNVSYSGDLVEPANTALTLTNGTAFTGANASLGGNAYLYWNQNGTLAGKALTLGSASVYGVIQVGANDALTFDSATTITGNSYIYGASGSTIVNQGAIAQTAGTGYLYAPTFTNQGTITVGTGAYLYAGSTSAGFAFNNAAGGSIVVTGGTVDLQSSLTNAGIINVQSGTFITNNRLVNGTTGTITGAGAISGSLAMAGGFLSPGNSIGTLTFISTGFSVTNASTLNIEISGSTADEMVFQNPTGVVALGAGLLTPNLILLSAPTPNTTYTIANISSGGSGFSGYLVGLPTSGSAIAASYLGTPYDFTVTYLANSISFTSVPEPGTVNLMMAGLLLSSAAAWRRRRLVTRR